MDDERLAPDDAAATAQWSRAAPAPVRTDLLTAIARYPLLVLLFVLLLGGLGAVIARTKTVTYTAKAAVLVAGPSPGTAGQLPGVVTAQQSLASIYAREITFNPVVRPLARQFHTSPSVIASRLSASPLANAPIITVQAQAPSSQGAVNLANAAAAKFTGFLTSQAQSAGPANQTLRNYQQAAQALARARAHQTQVGGGNSPASVAAAATVLQDQLILNALANQYQNAVGTRTNTPTVSFFESANSASSNGKSKYEIYIFAGIVAGLVIGAALASLLANRQVMRAARRGASAAA